jgi:hypothetical protein
MSTEDDYVRTFSNDLSTTFESNMENLLRPSFGKPNVNSMMRFRFVDPSTLMKIAKHFPSKPDRHKQPKPPQRQPLSRQERRLSLDQLQKDSEKSLSQSSTTITSATALHETLGTVPMELEMPQPSTPVTTAMTITSSATSESSFMEQELAEIEKEFNQYVESPLLSSSSTTTTTADNSDSDALMTTNVLTPEQNRFQQQLSGQWNKQILSSSSSSSSSSTTANTTTSTLLSNAMTPEDEPWFMETIRKQTNIGRRIRMQKRH